MRGAIGGHQGAPQRQSALISVPFVSVAISAHQRTLCGELEGRERLRRRSLRCLLLDDHREARRTQLRGEKVELFMTDVLTLTRLGAPHRLHEGPNAPHEVKSFLELVPPTHPRVMHELLEGSSVVIGGHRWPSVVINGHQWSSVVISSHQWSSVVITRTHLLDGQAFGRVLPE